MSENEEAKRAWDDYRMRRGTSCDPEMMAILRRYFEAGWEARGETRADTGATQRRSHP